MELGRVSVEGMEVDGSAVTGDTARGRTTERESASLVDAVAFTPELCDLNQGSPFICEMDMLSLRLSMKAKNPACDVPLSAIKQHFTNAG